MFSKLIGSRARGTARPNSDWDILVVPRPPIVSEAPWWTGLCVEIQKYERDALAAAYDYLKSRPDYDGGKVDVFLVVHWGKNKLAVLISEWDSEHGCYGGWLEPIPEEVGYGVSV
jgi:predicted nucleotidyltransferase